MKTILLILACLPAFAQTSEDEAAVRTTIKLMFDGMRKADSTQIKNTFLPGATLQTIAKNKEGAVSVRTDDMGKFAASVTKYPAFTLDERLSGMEIKIDAELATAWTPYVFYLKEAKSHCGVNAFTLVKVNGNWKIQNIIDTRRKENCPDLPKQ
ncbi:nuclear transport factor 2 family protein [Spirosoma sp. KCTC 42546]|uniref:nuclear transport factor 2 family protein n=1 Tax=Spirosoma sp. KCTC 42546 TaxID=2520506 RepID=UPI001158E581|nr:nuclear transport factor 2 family protein [Spirosoma sp. KCTC 42546]QDK78120.1 nuclear transport factor 2 family protein [Spirosoma sp. KCTC 42546]